VTRHRLKGGQPHRRRDRVSRLLVDQSWNSQRHPTAWVHPWPKVQGGVGRLSGNQRGAHKGKHSRWRRETRVLGWWRDREPASGTGPGDRRPRRASMSAQPQGLEKVEAHALRNKPRSGRLGGDGHPGSGPGLQGQV